MRVGPLRTSTRCLNAPSGAVLSDDLVQEFEDGAGLVLMHLLVLGAF